MLYKTGLHVCHDTEKQILSSEEPLFSEEENKVILRLNFYKFHAAEIFLRNW
jgi:hypothetical protein